ncbi:hypothetical protein MMC25_005664 [Agyrium rufum]|nr:hypothetical protein [Agyrium rufum]
MQTLGVKLIAVCRSLRIAFIVGFGNPDAAGVKYCDVFPNRHDNCVPDGNTFKGNSPDVQPPADNTKRSLSKPRGGIYMTESGTKVSFAADMEPGTHIRHAVIRSDTLQARAKQDARSALERRQATCDTGDGDEWDNDAAAPSTAAAIAVATSAVVALQSTVAAAANTTSSDPAGVTAVAVRRNLDKRTTAFDAYRMPVYEFVDDFVAHKMV